MTQLISTSLRRWIIIIITTPDILSKWCYLSIVLVIGSSTKPSLFHAGCRPSLHVGIYLLWHLYLTTCQKGPPLTSDHWRNTFTTMLERNLQHSHLTMGGTHPRTMSKRPNTYIHQHDRTHLLSSVKRHSTHNHQHDMTHLLSSMERLALTSTSMIGHTYYHLWKGSTLTSDHVGTNPIVTSEWLSVPD